MLSCKKQSKAVYQCMRDKFQKDFHGLNVSQRMLFGNSGALCFHTHILGKTPPLTVLKRGIILTVLRVQLRNTFNLRSDLKHNKNQYYLRV